MKSINKKSQAMLPCLSQLPLPPAPLWLLFQPSTPGVWDSPAGHRACHRHLGTALSLVTGDSGFLLLLCVMSETEEMAGTGQGCWGRAVRPSRSHSGSHCHHLNWH